MEKVFQNTVKKYGDKKALGTRKVIGEEDEVQENGRVFKKVLSFVNCKFLGIVNTLLTH